jgi:lipid-binding SYLF domain-containing protein
MSRIARCLAAATLLLALSGTARASDQQEIVDRAKVTVDVLRAESNFSQPIADLLRRAKGVLVVPNLFRAGFILGGEGGTGVLLVKGTDGSWSSPAFYGLGSGSIGLQIGAQSAEVMFIILTDGGLQKIMNNSVKVGADVSIAIGPVGAGIEGSTTANLRADIVAYSKAMGLFGGLSIEGTIISVREEWNRAYYGDGATARSIVIDRRFDSPGAGGLRFALANQ